MMTLIDKLISQIGIENVAKRGAVFAYVGWGLAIVFGCTGWWGGPFTGLTVAVALSCHLAGGRAQQLLGHGKNQQ